MSSTASSTEGDQCFTTVRGSPPEKILQTQSLANGKSLFHMTELFENQVTP